MTIHDFLSARALDLVSLGAFLDGLDAAARLRQVRDLRGREQAALFEAADGFRSVGLTELVPADAPPLTETIHHGRNSLPWMSQFEKRFCVPEATASEGWGYNQHPLLPLIGPGYFVARQRNAMEVEIDYSEIPSARPPSWPRVVPSSHRLGRLVYHGLHDVLRGVSRHVTVGRAFRAGQPLDNWFVLCRSEGSPAGPRVA